MYTLFLITWYARDCFIIIFLIGSFWKIMCVYLNYLMPKPNITWLYIFANQMAPLFFASTQWVWFISFFFFRKFDHENFLCTLLLPKVYQNASFVIRAFNIEIARIQDNVSDISIGQARLQFWNDAIDKLYTANVPAHPVIQELNKVSSKYSVSVECKICFQINAT